MSASRRQKITEETTDISFDVICPRPHRARSELHSHGRRGIVDPESCSHPGRKAVPPTRLASLACILLLRRLSRNVRFRCTFRSGSEMRWSSAVEVLLPSRTSTMESLALYWRRAEPLVLARGSGPRTTTV